MRKAPSPSLNTTAVVRPSRAMTVTAARGIRRPAASTTTPVTASGAWTGAAEGTRERDSEKSRAENDDTAGLLTACVRAVGWWIGPGGQVSWLADRRILPRLPIRLRVACATLRRDSGLVGEDTPRLQWRHRVGFAPTSRDRPE